MQTSAKVKFIHTSPRKVRLVVDVVRGMEVDKALSQLRLMNKGVARPVMKLINSVIANAEHNFELNKNNLFIKEIFVDEAPTLKRWMPRAHGRATTIRKRNSHINIVLAEIKDTGKKKGKKQEVEAPVKLGDMNKKEKEEVKKEVKQDKKIEVEETRQKLKNSGRQGDDFDKQEKEITPEEVVKEINDPRRESRGGHARLEGGKKGFVSKIFRRKSG